MIKIASSDFGNPKYLTISRVAEVIQISISNPTLRNVINHLFNIGVIRQEDQVGASKIISIDKERLENLIYEQESVIPVIKFYEDQHSVII